MAELHLPDVSEFQPNVDWPAVAKHNGGAAIIRALYGAEHVDKVWAAGRRHAAHKAGIGVLGIYQYLRADEDPVAQARAFVGQVGKLERGEFAVLDLEEGAGGQSHRAKAWLDYVDEHLTYGGYHRAWLYSGDAFLRSQLTPFVGPQDHSRRIWVADYGAKPDVRHDLWQHTDGTHAVPNDWHQHGWPGIGRCDCSVFAGTLQEFRAKVFG
jgi:GH25 family lysozyme M1 (1,4-beta-N-acetylmuramidase)